MEKRTIVTTSDNERLKQLVESTSPQADYVGLDALEQELDRAEIVTPDKISKNIVTMNSRVRLHDLDRDAEFVCSIVFPAEANSDQKRISVLAPLKGIEYQPEAAARERVAA
jgi:regulator of nucleoside diphosphate kinase